MVIDLDKIIIKKHSTGFGPIYYFASDLNMPETILNLISELRAAREVVKCANRYLWEADDADASKMKKALKAYREAVE